MNRDEIFAVGIDEEGRLYVKPRTTEFVFVYREAMEVNWDVRGRFLYSPKPREWFYFSWFKQICAAAEQQGYKLTLAPDCAFENIQRTWSMKFAPGKPPAPNSRY